MNRRGFLALSAAVISLVKWWRWAGNFLGNVSKPVAADFGESDCLTRGEELTGIADSKIGAVLGVKNAESDLESGIRVVGVRGEYKRTNQTNVHLEQE